MSSKAKKNAIICGFRKDALEIDNTIRDLEKSGYINIKYWFGGDHYGNKLDCDEEFHDFTFFRGKVSEFDNSKDYIDIYNKVRESCFEGFMTQAYRRYYDTCRKNVPNAQNMRFFTLTDVINEFNIIVNKSYHLIKDHKIDVIIAHAFFHHGSDFIMYHVAKAMNIKTISFVTLHPLNKVFKRNSMSIPILNFDDVGFFKENPIISQKIDVKLDDSHYVDLDYMKHPVTTKKIDGKSVKIFDHSKKIDRAQDINDNLKALLNKKEEIEKKRFLASSRIRSGKIILLLIKKALFKLKLIKRDQIKVNLLTNESFSSFDTNYLMFNNDINIIEKRIGFFKDLEKYSTQDIDLNKKFIYFPLHYQPEITSDPFGDIYSDQILAIEKLSLLLPQDWHIYVKENPVQDIQSRGFRFFDRLNSIKNATLVSHQIDTLELIKHCQIVATLTGTAGFEAIKGKKPVITFGRAWYRNFDGVFEYNPNLNLENIAKYQIDVKKISQSISDLSEKCIEATFDIGGMYEDFNKEQNQKNIYKAITTILDQRF